MLISPDLSSLLMRQHQSVSIFVYSRRLLTAFNTDTQVAAYSGRRRIAKASSTTLMLRRAWKPLAATVVIGTPSYLYYTSKYKQDVFELAVKVRNSDGKTVTMNRTFPLLSLDKVDERIRERAQSETNPRPNGVLWKHTIASLAANDPIEDASSSQIIERDDSDPSAPGDLLFFTVMDGHSGPHTSRLLSKVLINAVVLELNNFIKDPEIVAGSSGFIGSITSTLRSGISAAPSVAGDPKYVSQVIQNAFTKLDQELINGPKNILASSIDIAAAKKGNVPDLSQHPLALPTMLPAISGTWLLIIPHPSVDIEPLRQLCLDGYG